MATLALTVAVPERYHEFIIAELAEIGFESFEEATSELIAYGQASIWDDVSREHVERWLRAVDLTPQLREEIIPDTNWNALWESSIQPISVGPFLIKPSWHPDDGSHPIVLEIDPKMAFGTGYHESTRLALGLLAEAVGADDSVLDAGCGTGILALAALKLGARSALGFDIDPWSRVNAYENAERNGLASRFEVREGSMEVVPETGFDIILANITRQSLLGMLADLTARLNPAGRLVMAGLLVSDRAQMLEAAETHGLRLHEEASENEWWAGLWRLQPAKED